MQYDAIIIVHNSKNTQMYTDMALYKFRIIIIIIMKHTDIIIYRIVTTLIYHQ